MEPKGKPRTDKAKETTKLRWKLTRLGRYLAGRRSI
jgi:hypothetical protein